MYLVCQALLEPGDEVVIPDPEWPPCAGNIPAAQASAGRHVRCTSASDGASTSTSSNGAITPRTRAIYLNSPHNPTGGVLTRDDIERDRRDRRGNAKLWLVSDEAYEDILFDGAEHISPASLPGMYERTLSVFTFSKIVRDDRTAARVRGGQGSEAARADEEGPVLHRSNVDVGRAVRRHRCARRVAGSHRRIPRRTAGAPGSVLRGDRDTRRATSSPARRRAGRSTRSCAINPGWRPGRADAPAVGVMGDGRALIRAGGSDASPGSISAPTGEGYIRFCFARDRRELTGALSSMRELFAGACFGVRGVARRRGPVITGCDVRHPPGWFRRSRTRSRSETSRPGPPRPRLPSGQAVSPPRRPCTPHRSFRAEP